MAPKVHPQDLFSTSSSSNTAIEREAFTVWMKSLVMNSNGCTVYDSKGEIVYRIDNYNTKCRNKVHIMDNGGNILSTILKKRLRVFGRWEGYNTKCSKMDEGKPWFQVRKYFKFLKSNKKSPYDITTSNATYTMERWNRKIACRIVDQAGHLVAEMKQKKSSSGVVLGDDVLILEVEADVDHSLILGLIVVHGLINHKL